jgi:hypothetical protein
MKVYTDVSHDEVGTDTGQVVALLRRVGVTVGFLFGLGLLALVMAGQASAEEAAQDDGAQPRAGQSLLSPVHDVLSPVTEPVGRLLEPVVQTAADVVVPVVQPVAEVIEPITESVVGPVLRPVVESVLAPVLTPVVDAVTPVIDPVAPVADAVEPPRGVSTVPEPVSGERQYQRETGVPQERAALTPAWVDDSTAEVTEWTVRSKPNGVADASASVASVVPDGTGQPGQSPNVPVGPTGVAPGGNGSLGGSGGSHSADAAVSAPRGSLSNTDSTGRSPPGTIDGLPWNGYAQPDCPS